MNPTTIKQWIQTVEECWHVVEPFLLRLLLMLVFVEEMLRAAYRMLVAG